MNSQNHLSFRDMYYLSLEASQLSLSLVDICDVLMSLLIVLLYLFKIKLSFVLYFLFKNKLVFYDFLLNIMFLILVPILCVHASLWTCIFVIEVHLETYTHETSYLFNWYSFSLVTTVYGSLFSGGS